jgi:hypothetical protein
MVARYGALCCSPISASETQALAGPDPLQPPSLGDSDQLHRHIIVITVFIIVMFLFLLALYIHSPIRLHGIVLN